MAFAFALVLFGTQFATAQTTFYVATDGNDLWTGSNPEFQGGNVGPLRTITAALTKAAANGTSVDTIVIEAGDYNTGGDTGTLMLANVTLQVRQDTGSLATVVTLYGNVVVNGNASIAAGEGTFDSRGNLSLTTGTLTLAPGVLTINDATAASSPAIDVTQGNIAGSAPVWSDPDFYTFTVNAGSSTTVYTLNLAVPSTVTTFTNNRNASGALAVSAAFTVTTALNHNGASAASFSGAVTFAGGVFNANAAAGNFTATAPWQFNNVNTTAINVVSGAAGTGNARTVQLAATNFNGNTGGLVTSVINVGGYTTLSFSGAVTKTVGGTAGSAIAVDVNTVAANGALSFGSTASIDLLVNAGTTTFGGTSTVAAQVNNTGTIVNNSTVTLTAAVTFTQIGTVNGANGTLVLGTNGQVVADAAAIAGNLNANPGAGNATTFSANIVVSGTLTIVSGTTTITGGALTNITAGEVFIANNATYSQDNSTLTVNRGFSMGATGVLSTDNTETTNQLVFTGTVANAIFSPRPNFNYFGAIIVNKAGRTVTWQQSATISGANQAVTGSSIPVVFFVQAGVVDFVDETLILPVDGQAVEINGITEADTGGIQFQGLGQDILGAGEFTNIVVVPTSPWVDSSSNLQVRTSNVRFNGTISLLTAGITITTFDLSAVANSDARILRDMITPNSAIVLVAPGTMNGLGNRYDLEVYSSAVMGGTQNFGAELTALLRDLYVHTDGTVLVTGSNPAVVDVGRVFQVDAGATINGANPTMFDLTGASQTHPILGTVGATVLDIIRLSGANSVLQGTAAASNQSLVPSVVVNATGVAITNIHRITGDLTTNAGSSATLTLTQDNPGTSTDPDNAEIDGDLYLNGDSFVLGASVWVQGMVGVDHNSGLLDVADSNMTVDGATAGGPPAFDGTPVVTPSSPVTYNADAAGFFVMNFAGASFGVAGNTVSNLRLDANTTLASTSSVKNMTDINGTLTGATAVSPAVPPSFFAHGPVNVSVASAWVAGSTAGAFNFLGSMLTEDSGTLTPTVTFGNVVVNSATGLTLFKTAVTGDSPAIFVFGQGGTVAHDAGTVAIGGETLQYSGPVTVDADCVDCNYTGAGTDGTNTGALVLSNAGSVNTNGVDVMVDRLTQASGTSVLLDESIVSVGHQLILSGGQINTYTGGHAGGTSDPFVAQTLNIADGTNIYRSSGYINGDAVIGGDNTNVTYGTPFVATKTETLSIFTGSELHTTVNNLTVNWGIAVQIDGASDTAGGGDSDARDVTVCGVFDVNEHVYLKDMGLGTDGTVDSNVILCDGATMLVGLDGAFDSPITGGNDNVLAYDSGTNQWTDVNSWPAGWMPTLRVATSNLWLTGDHTAANIVFVGSNQLNLYGHRMNVEGDVTQGSAGVPVYSGSFPSTPPYAMGPGGILAFTGAEHGTWTVSTWNGPNSGGAATTPYVVAIDKETSDAVVTLTGGAVDFSHGQGVVPTATQTPNMFAFVNGILATSGNAVVKIFHGINNPSVVPVQPDQGFVACGTIQGEDHPICDTQPEGAVSGVEGNVQKVALSNTGGGSNVAIHNNNIQFPLASSAEAVATKADDMHGAAQYRGVTLFFPTAPQSDVLVTMDHTGYTSPAGTRGFPIAAGDAGPLTNYADFYWTLKTSVSLPPSFQFEASFIADGYTPPVSSPDAEDIRLIRRHNLNVDNEWILQNGNYDNSKDANDDVTVTLRNAAIGGFVTTGIRFTIGEKNLAPVFTSAPAAADTVAQGNTWSATYAITDVDIGDSGTMSLVAGADYSGLTFNPSTGALVWEVGFDTAPGNYPVTVRATDTNGASRDATTLVTVLKTNRAPVFTAFLADGEAVESAALTFDYNADDPDGDPLWYAIVPPVDGAEIDSLTGMLTYTPAFANAGSDVTITVVATDVPDGATASTSATLSVKHSLGLCDVTQNNECSALDADWVLQNSAGNRDFSDAQDWAGDVSGANTVTAYDASLILQYDAGFISTFPAGDPLATKGGDFGSADFVWGEFDWSEGVSARVPVALDGQVSEVYAVTIATNVDPALAKVEGVQVNVPENWKQLVSYNEETGDLVILAAGARPIMEATDLANIQLTMVDETAELALAAQAFINEKAAVDLEELSVKQVPTEYDLAQNYPNPFNPTTTIQYALPQDGHVTLEIYDVTGRLVNMLVNGEQEAGRYRMQWDGRTATGSQVASGIYIYRLRAGSFVQSKTMMLVK